MPRSIREWPLSMSSAEKTEKSKNFLPAGIRQGVCYTYLLACADGSLYCGWTNDLERRLTAHNRGTGGRYTRTRRPVSLAYAEPFGTKEEAMRREWEIKQMSRAEKLRLISSGTSSDPEGGEDGTEEKDAEKTETDGKEER